MHISARTAAVGVVMATSTALGACGARGDVVEARPTPPASTSASAPSTSLPPSVAPPPIQVYGGAGGTPAPATTPNYDPLPAAGRSHDAAGAKVFTAWFMAQYDRVLREDGRGIPMAYTEPTCQMCLAMLDAVVQMYSEGRRFTTPDAPNATSSASVDTDGSATVVVTVPRHYARLVDTTGATVDAGPVRGTVKTFLLGWQAGSGWRVQEILIRRTDT